MRTVGTAIGLSNLGFIGLGLVGQALAARALAAGYACGGTDLQPDAVSRFVALGGVPVASVAELAAGCSVLVTALMTTTDVQAALAPVLAPTQRGDLATHTVIDCSTGSAHEVQALHEALAARGVAFIEAPLSGSSEQIAAGQATALVAGHAADIDAVDAVLAALSPTRIRVGGPGMGAVAKLATNLVLGLNRAALAEGMAFAQSQGMAAGAFLQLVLATPARSDAALVKGERMVAALAGQHAPPQSRIRQHLKDLRQMQEAAANAGQALPLTSAHAALLQAAVDAGHGDLDNAAIVQTLREMKAPPTPSSHA